MVKVKAMQLGWHGVMETLFSVDPMNIERGAATVFHGDWVTSYPMLNDDGTNGEQIADDGIYSLEVKAPDMLERQRLFFMQWILIRMSRSLII